VEQERDSAKMAARAANELTQVFYEEAGKLAQERDEWVEMSPAPTAEVPSKRLLLDRDTWHAAYRDWREWAEKLLTAMGVEPKGDADARAILEGLVRKP